MQTKKKCLVTDYIQANRKGSRKAEITDYSRPLNPHRVHVSPKVDDRKRRCPKSKTRKLKSYDL
ncbi:MAG: hypothetical protein LIP06_10930 [Tannerellaceae bacterium]|nr:hypothetical protein [Tannerellaceae bacterium]